MSNFLDMIRVLDKFATVKGVDASASHASSAHAPVNAQKNSDITKAEIEAKLTEEITSHTHPGGSGGLTQAQVRRLNA